MSSAAFGSFNPNFYGISSSLGDDSIIESWISYVQEDDLVVWRAAQEDFDLGKLGTISSMDHEIRHFHDFLLSPFAAQSMIYRLQATMNGTAALLGMESIEGGFVPTPLCKWMMWPAGKREGWVRTNGKWAGVESVAEMISLPEIDLSKRMARTIRPLATVEEAQEEFKKVVEGAARSYLSLQVVRTRRDWGFGMEMSADDIFEATAHAIQAVSIYKGQGQEPYNEFMTYIDESEQPFLLGLKVLSIGLQKHRSGVDTRRLLELFTWMLLGSIVEQKGHPSIRFGIVMTVAAKAPTLLTDRIVGSTADLWDLLDEATGQTLWRENLRSAREYIRTRVDMFVSLASASKSNHPETNPIIRLARMWFHDLEKMQDFVLSDPDGYCDPVRYLYETSTLLPLPYLLIHWGKGVYRHPNPGRLGSDTRTVFIDPNEETVLYSILNMRSGSKRDMDAVADVYSTQKMLDYIFYEETTHRLLDQHYLDKARAFTGKTFLNVY